MSVLLSQFTAAVAAVKHRIMSNEEENVVVAEAPEAEEVPKKRGRGRPPKSANGPAKAAAPKPVAAAAGDSNGSPKRRGRPPKAGGPKPVIAKKPKPADATGDGVAPKKRGRPAKNAQS